MNGIFKNVGLFAPKRNKFNLSHERKLSCKMGDLIPIMLQEVIPGDKFRVSSEIFMRLAPMISPVMHRINVSVHYFFVPERLLWDEFEDFITGGEDGLEAPVPPTVIVNDVSKALFQKGSLGDYMGIPPIPDDSNQGIKINSRPFRAYQMIYNEYYRDQNLIEKVDIEKTGGNSDDLDELTKMRKRAWEKDYFTSALPWSQRGGDVNVATDIQYKNPSQGVSQGGSPSLVDGEPIVLGAGDVNVRNIRTETSSEEIIIDNIEDIGITINALRQANKLQEWLEKNARAGSRYIEQIKSHFGVTSSDARLQRPEFLGGGKQNVVISEVLNTTGQIDTSESPGIDQPLPQGNMSGHGISVGKSNRFKRSFEEHGFVIGIMSTLPKTAYQQGVDKLWSRETKEEYYWPEFADLGEQEVLNQEIYMAYEGTNPQLKETFGYQQRYAEYKFQKSSVHGDFRDNLLFWHMGRQFNGIPALNESFVTADPTNRIFAVADEENPDNDEDQLYCQIYNSVQALRPMPYFGIPKL